jgi:hypothetical protein
MHLSATISTMRWSVNKTSLCLHASNSSALDPTQPPIQSVPRTLSTGVKRPKRDPTTHLHLDNSTSPYFYLHHRVQNDSGAHPASYPMGTRGSFPGIKRPGREADHSHPSSAEVKEYVELYLHSPIRLHGVVLSLKKKSTWTALPSPYQTSWCSAQLNTGTTLTCLDVKSHTVHWLALPFHSGRFKVWIRAQKMTEIGLNIYMQMSEQYSKIEYGCILPHCSPLIHKHPTVMHWTLRNLSVFWLWSSIWQSTHLKLITLWKWQWTDSWENKTLAAVHRKQENSSHGIMSEYSRRR